MIDINTFLDYQTGISNSGNISDLQRECENYNCDLLSSLNLFKKMPHSPFANIHINTRDIVFNWYGSNKIRDSIDLVVACCGHNSYLINLIDELIDLLELLNSMYLHHVDNIAKVIKRINVIRGKLKEFYEDRCKDCLSRNCRNAIANIIESLPQKTDMLGCFYPNHQIIIYTKAIALNSSAKEEFNAMFWSTLAHETFHLYHYALCESNPDPYYWNNTLGDSKTRWGNNESEGSFLEDDRIIRYGNEIWDNPDMQNRRNEIPIGMQIKGTIPDGDIVKESLASYFEYYYGIYSENVQIQGMRKTCDALKNSWYGTSPQYWPYAGARAFVPDRDKIFEPDALFSRVLDISLYDWAQACDIILDAI